MFKRINFFVYILSICFSTVLYSGGVPHAVVGTLQYSDGRFPSTVDWKAFITARSTDVLEFEKPSLYDSLSGGFLIQCAGFLSWTAGETLHVDFTDNQNAAGSADVVLTFNPVDDAGVIILKEPAGVEHSDNEKPVKFELYQNYPNPFNPETVIAFMIDTPQYVTLNIYNSSGQLIKTLFSGFKGSGEHHVIWNGKDRTGCPAASGLYLYVLNGENFTRQLKAHLLR
ncbi:T9SS type A sorting domain-containing protein [candidate division KSB1 bacterium]|nr:T9SS type A sorting domain-containing protein [candidate division KSB1 bacterium]